MSALRKLAIDAEKRPARKETGATGPKPTVAPVQPGISIFAYEIRFVNTPSNGFFLGGVR